MNVLTFKIVSSRTSWPVSILSYVNANFVFTFLYGFYCKWQMLQFCLTSLLASFPRVGWSFQMGSAYQFHSWRVFVLVCAFPSVAAISALTTMPESPRFFLEVSLTAHTPLRPCGNIFLNTFWTLESINSLKDKVLLMHFSRNILNNLICTYLSSRSNLNIGDAEIYTKDSEFSSVCFKHWHRKKRPIYKRNQACCQF